MTLTTNSPSQKLNLAQFVRQLPDEEGHYELVNGEIVRILATRRHETIAEFISDLFKAEVKLIACSLELKAKFKEKQTIV